MRAIVCAACKVVIGYIPSDGDPHDRAQALAVAHLSDCMASEEDYEQAVYDYKFNQITNGLDL